MRKGFTLIELIVVIAIIAVLAAVVAPNAFKAIEKGKRSAAIADYKTIKTATMAYYADTGVWPPDATSDCHFVLDPSDAACSGAVSGWDGPYIEKWPAKTPWGESYTFTIGDFDNQDSVNDRYISIGAVNISSAGQIDALLDGEDGCDSGSIRDSSQNAQCGTNDLWMLISLDI